MCTVVGACWRVLRVFTVCGERVRGSYIQRATGGGGGGGPYTDVWLPGSGAMDRDQCQPSLKSVDTTD